MCDILEFSVRFRDRAGADAPARSQRCDICAEVIATDTIGAGDAISAEQPELL
jgi:hypothetical protein